MFNQQNIHHLLLENIENYILSKPHTLFDLVDPSVLIFKFFFGLGFLAAKKVKER